MSARSLPGVVPRPRLLGLTLAAAALLALGTLSSVFVALAAVVLVATIGLAIADYRLAPRMGPSDVSRVAEPQLIIGAPNRIGLALRNPTPRPLRMRVRDEVPVSFAVAPRVSAAVLDAGGAQTVEYVARPRYRGSFRFGALHTRQRGPLDLIERQSDIPADAPAHVYPDLREIRRYEVSLRRGLAYDAGQRRARIPGAGSVFERLREYGPDDDPRSISWAATA
ncbi:MAG: DUF58 domain-containing protein, partial [Chloroflexota bacterium]|nr:DUF58 domain-containing protein [Chloroflexota bacterium]